MNSIELVDGGRASCSVGGSTPAKLVDDDAATGNSGGAGNLILSSTRLRGGIGVLSQVRFSAVFDGSFCNIDEAGRVFGLSTASASAVGDRVDVAAPVAVELALAAFFGGSSVAESSITTASGCEACDAFNAVAASFGGGGSKESSCLSMSHRRPHSELTSLCASSSCSMFSESTLKLSELSSYSCSGSGL